ARQDLPLFEWKATRGLLRIGTREPLYETEKPSQALKTAAGMECEALYLFHDLQIYFDDPGILRQLRDLRESFNRDRRTLILCAPEISIPTDLHSCTVQVELALPDLEELKMLAVRTLRDLGAPKPIKVELSLPETEQLGGA